MKGKVLMLGTHPQSNYAKKLEKLISAGKLGSKPAGIRVYHDDWCAVYKTGVCNCNLDIEIREAS